MAASEISSQRRQKRHKVNHPPAFEQVASKFAKPTVPELQKPKEQTAPLLTTTAATATALSSPTPAVLPQHLAHLSTKYSLASMSITSNSKMQQKVRRLLAHLSRFSFADVNARPGVVALHARAAAAGKMVGVVEIVKREVEGERGRWFQYSRVAGSVEEVKARRKGRKEGAMGEKDEEWRGKGRTVGEGQRMEEDEKSRRDESGDTVKGKETWVHADGDEEMVDLQDEDEAAFETMAPKSIAERPKVRAVPIMTIYMSRVPVPEFKEEFGYIWKTPKLC